MKYNNMQIDNQYPLVSICVPIYGVEKYIERCAVTLFEQTYDNIEYIFVNDCTPDESINILQRLIENYPKRENKIKIVNHTKNKGLSASRNTAVKNAEGEFIIHVDSDDYVEKKLVEVLVNKSKEFNAEIVSSTVCVHTSNKIFQWHAPNEVDPIRLSLSMVGRVIPFNIWGRLIKRELYTKNDIKAVEGVNMGEDYQVMPVLVYNASKIAYTSTVLYHYNFANPNNYSNSFSIEREEQRVRSFKIIYDFFFDKGEEFVVMLERAQISIFIRRIKIAISCNKVEYYQKICDEMYKADLDCRKVPLYDKPFVFLHCFKILSLYYKFCAFFLNLLKK